MRREPLIAMLWIAACGGTASTDAAPARVDGAGVDSGTASYCNVQYQTSCNPGDRCTKLHLAAGLSTPACVPEPGSVPLGDACTITDTIDDCVAGGICIDGVCERACDGGDCTSGFCPYPDVVCWAACDPLDPVCVSGKSCYPPYANHEGPGCAPSGNLAVGAKCQAPNDCAPGSTCAAEVGAHCVLVCRIGGGAPACSGTDICTARHATESYGVCLPP